MSILYVTRNLNHSGYQILKKLIEENIPIKAVIVPNNLSSFDFFLSSFFAKIFYKIRSRYQGFNPCKAINSERLLAKKFGIPVYQIKSMKSKNFHFLLEKIKPEVIFLGGGWPELIPEDIINQFPDSIFNTHPSLLPDFRGTSITRWQILKGASYSGITVTRVEKSFDNGNIITQKKYRVKKNETPQSLFKNLGKIGAEMVYKLLKETNNLKNLSEIKELKQSSIKKTRNYHSVWRWGWNEQRIDLKSKSLIDIERFIRANNQESYHYIGPHILINNEYFILRESEIFLKYDSKNSKNNYDLFAYKLNKTLVTDRGIEIISKDRSSILIIKKIQKWDKYLFIRKARKPSYFFKSETTIKLESSPFKK